MSGTYSYIRVLKNEQVALTYQAGDATEYRNADIASQDFPKLDFTSGKSSKECGTTDARTRIFEKERRKDIHMTRR